MKQPVCLVMFVCLTATYGCKSFVLIDFSCITFACEVRVKSATFDYLYILLWLAYVLIVGRILYVVCKYCV